MPRRIRYASTVPCSTNSLRVSWASGTSQCVRSTSFLYGIWSSLSTGVESTRNDVRQSLLAVLPLAVLAIVKAPFIVAVQGSSRVAMSFVAPDLYLNARKSATRDDDRVQVASKLQTPLRAISNSSSTIFRTSFVTLSSEPHLTVSGIGKHDDLLCDTAPLQSFFDLVIAADCAA